jgi:amino acid adenylation domain-containing protein
MRAFAASTPDAPALRAPDRSLSYGQLMSEADGLADAILLTRSAPGECVLIPGARCADTVVSLVAALVAGVPFMVVDDRSRPAVLELALGSTPSRLAIAGGEFGGRLADLGYTVVPPGGHACAALPRDVPPDVLAYIVSTSGTTGRPKHIAVERRHLAAYVDAVLDRLSLTAPTSFASVSPLWTDLGHTAIFCALCTGGQFSLISAESGTSAARLGAEFSAFPVDYLKITPSHLTALLTDENASVLPRVGVVLGGERLPWALCTKVRGLRADLKLINHYGPAECTIGVAAGPVPTDLPEGARSVPVGPPLRGTHFAVLSAERNPVPEGEVGELYVSGPTVAREYLGDPALTAERFVALEGDTARWYRTGDLARPLLGDRFEIVGRVDRQVKVRGFRVEPGEVEHALLAGGLVTEAYAFAVTSDSGTAMAAAVVVRTGATAAEIIEDAAARLSAAAIPAPVLILDQLPRAASGKVDEAALTALAVKEFDRPSSAAATYLTATEKDLADAWAEILGREVDTTTSVFQLGANSITAIRFLARLQRQYDVEIPLHVVFETPTVAELAALVDESLTERSTIGRKA